MTRILVTGAGGAAAVAVIEALLRDGCTVHAADMSGHAAGLYLVPSQRRHLVDAAIAPTFVANLIAICERNQIDLLIPTVDAELGALARERRAFESRGTKVLVASPSAIRRCLDKLELSSVAATVAWTPRTERFDDHVDPASWIYPVIVKPRTGSGGRGVMEIESREQLARLNRSDELIIQDYAPGIEYSVDVLATQLGRVVAAVPRARLKVDSGVAVAATTVHDDELEELAVRITSAIGLTGVANLQFRRDRVGRPTLIEINPRFPGTMPLTIAAGVNMPVYVVRDMLGLPLPSIERFREIAMVRTWREHFVPVAEMEALTSGGRVTALAG